MKNSFGCHHMLSLFTPCSCRQECFLMCFAKLKLRLYFLWIVKKKKNYNTHTQNPSLHCMKRKVKIFKVRRWLHVNHRVNKPVEGKQYFNRGHHTINPDLKYCTAQWSEEMLTAGSWFIQTHTHSLRVTHTRYWCLLRVKNKSPLWHLCWAAASFQTHCGTWQYPRQERHWKDFWGDRKPPLAGCTWST